MRPRPGYESPLHESGREPLPRRTAAVAPRCSALKALRVVLAVAAAIGLLGASPAGAQTPGRRTVNGGKTRLRALEHELAQSRALPASSAKGASARRQSQAAASPDSVSLGTIGTGPDWLSGPAAAPGRSAVPARAALRAFQNGDGTFNETVGGNSNTWTNYTNAGGSQGPTIPAFTTVEIACVVQGFRVSDGNTAWYQIASAPWSYAYFVSADAFYNNGATSGSLRGTPFVDPAVPACGTGGGTLETAGGAANTWTNPANAGGTQGPTIGGGTSVGIACKLQGFRVADGNTWWYRISQTPWNNGFYVSADAFYNTPGQTSGTLKGTPFVDPAVPDCQQQPAPSGGVNETVGGDSHTFTDYLDAGGVQGPTIPNGTTVTITCKITGFQVQDGDTWWYLVGSAPWSSNYFVSADAFYNDGQTSGSLHGTPFVDPAVPDCVSNGERPAPETPAAPISTWANYSHPDGAQGPPITAGQAVQVSCRIQGYAGSDNDPWWYRLAGAPWNDVYYVQADVFQTGGQTGQVDTSVPICDQNVEAPLYGTAIGSANATAHGTSGIDGQVDGASGDFWDSFTDVAVPGRGPGLSLSRTYNALAPASAGLFGYGWTSAYDQHIVLNSDGSFTIALEDGSKLTATPSGGGFTTPSWSNATFAANSDGTYTLTRHSTLIERFAGPASSGRLISLGDLNGNQVTLAYDGNGHLASITDGAGRAITVAVGANGFVSSVSDPIGRQTTYAYSSGGDLISATGPLGREWQYGYDASHRMTSITDPRGKVAQNVFDDQGRVVAQVDPAGLKTTFAYGEDNFSSLGGTTTVTDPHGVVRVEQYANGFMTTETTAYGTPDAATWTYSYDPVTYGLLSTTDPNGHITSSTYDSNGDPLSVTDALGHVSSSTYNALGEVLTSTAPSGALTRNSYDARGNLLAVTDPLGKTSTSAYADPNHPGDVTSTTDGDGRVTRLTYDAYGDVASTTVTPSAGVSDTTTSVYDADGERTCEVSPDATAAGVSCPAAGGAHVAKTTSWTFDAAGRTTSETEPGGGTTSYAFDPDDNPTSTTDPDGTVSTTSYDADDRPVSSETDASSTSKSITTSAYDIAPGSAGCPATATYCDTTTDANGGVTVAAFDDQGGQIERIRPGGQTLRFAYDAAGEPTQETDARGITASHSYDADGAEIGITYSDGTPGVTSKFNADGQRTSMSDGSGTTTYSVDADGRSTSITDGSGATVAYAYDGSGNVTSLTYPGGHVVTRTFDGAGELTSIKDWLGNVTRFKYDADGNVISTLYPTGNSVNATYDVQDALTKASLVTSSKAAVAAASYVRDPAEEITKEGDSGAITGDTAYTSDARHEMTASGTSSFSYDAAGQPTGFAASTQTFDAAGELAAIASPGVATKVAFDADGDRTDQTPTWGSETQLRYDGAGRLVSVTEATPAPAVTGVTPSSGPDAGATPVSIAGSGFSAATAVTFGGRAATSFTVLSDRQISAIAPPGSAGAAHVVVATATASSSPTAADSFSYTHAAAITALSPSAGALAGGTTVTITGGDFTGASKVLFGSASAPFTVTSDGQLTAVAPKGSGAVRIEVITAGNGTTAAVPADKYVYVDGPTISSIAPLAGPAAGGTTVTVLGSGLAGATGVLFGGVPAAHFTVKSDAALTAVAPPGAGAATITVDVGTTPTTVVGAARYTYAVVPSVTGLSEISGPAGGGTNVTVSGRGFTSDSRVMFGGTTASSEYVSGSTVLAIAPAGSGSADVTVATPGGQSATSSVDAFSYAPQTTSYGYDGNGMRVSATTGGATEHFAWDSSTSVPELLDDGTNSYIYGPDGLPIEQISDASGAPDYYLHDALGSTRVLIDQTGAVAATFSYTPFGGLAASTGSARTPLLFAGGYRDADTDLTYLINRYYDPSTGEFITLDPALDASGTPYGYAGDDPANGSDPLGLLHLNWKIGLDVALGAAGVACAIAEPCGEIAVAGVEVTGVDAVGALTFGSDVVDAASACSEGKDCAASVALAALGGHDLAWAAALKRLHAARLGTSFYEGSTSILETTAAVGHDTEEASQPAALSSIPAAVTRVLTGALQVTTASPSGPISLGTSSSQSRTYNPQPTTYNPQPAAYNLQPAAVTIQGGGALPYGAHITGVAPVRNPRLI
jgi:RHS repeat-associated protein